MNVVEEGRRTVELWVNLPSRDSLVDEERSIGQPLRRESLSPPVWLALVVLETWVPSTYAAEGLNIILCDATELLFGQLGHVDIWVLRSPSVWSKESVALERVLNLVSWVVDPESDALGLESVDVLLVPALKLLEDLQGRCDWSLAAFVWLGQAEEDDVVWAGIASRRVSQGRSNALRALNTLTDALKDHIRCGSRWAGQGDLGAERRCRRQRRLSHLSMPVASTLTLICGLNSRSVRVSQHHQSLVLMWDPSSALSESMNEGREVLGASQGCVSYLQSSPGRSQKLSQEGLVSLSGRVSLGLSSQGLDGVEEGLQWSGSTICGLQDAREGGIDRFT